MKELVGQTLNRYKLVSLLGEGGMGAVFKGHDVTLQRDVAIKIMHGHFARQPNFQERFLQEARTAARIELKFMILARPSHNFISSWSSFQAATSET